MQTINQYCKIKSENHTKAFSTACSHVYRHSSKCCHLQQGRRSVLVKKKYEKVDNGIIYDDVLSTTKSKLYFLLSSNKLLKISDKNNFVVNDVNIKGQEYGVMIFT